MTSTPADPAGDHPAVDVLITDCDHSDTLAEQSVLEGRS